MNATDEDVDRDVTQHYPPIETILPHRGTMLLVDIISAFSDETLSAYATVRADAWYADADGAMPAWIGPPSLASTIRPENA